MRTASPGFKLIELNRWQQFKHKVKDNFKDQLKEEFNLEVHRQDSREGLEFNLQQGRRTWEQFKFVKRKVQR